MGIRMDESDNWPVEEIMAVRDFPKIMIHFHPSQHPHIKKDTEWVYAKFYLLDNNMEKVEPPYEFAYLPRHDNTITIDNQARKCFEWPFGEHHKIRLLIKPVDS